MVIPSAGSPEVSWSRLSTDHWYQIACIINMGLGDRRDDVDQFNPELSALLKPRRNSCHSTLLGQSELICIYARLHGK
jgi:hypothetical protein